MKRPIELREFSGQSICTSVEVNQDLPALIVGIDTNKIQPRAFTLSSIRDGEGIYQECDVHSILI